MYKILCVVIGLAATAVAGENNPVPFFTSKVTLETGYKTQHTVNGLAYQGDSAYATASIAAVNKVVTPTVAFTYMPKNGAESETHFTLGLDKTFDLYKVNATASASVTRHDVGVDASTGLKDNDEYAVGLRINNFPLIVPSVTLYKSVGLDTTGVIAGIEQTFVWKGFSMTPAAQYGWSGASDWWSVGSTLRYKLTSNLTPFVNVALIDNQLRNTYRELDHKVTATAGVRFTF